MPHFWISRSFGDCCIIRSVTGAVTRMKSLVRGQGGGAFAHGYVEDDLELARRHLGDEGLRLRPEGAPDAGHAITIGAIRLGHLDLPLHCMSVYLTM